MRKKLITRKEAIEAIKALLKEVPKDSRIQGERVNAEITELLFCLRHQEDGVDLFGADAFEAMFIASNFKGTKDYPEKRKRQLKLEQKYSMRKPFPEDKWDGFELDQGDREDGLWND